MSIFSISILAVCLSFLISYISVPWVILFANKLGLVDDPAINKHPKVIHTKPIPRAGGLGIFVSIVVTCFVFLNVNKLVTGILLGSSLMVIIGILDDKYNINPYVRLLSQFIAASLPILSGIGIAYISNPTGGIIDLSNPKISINLFGEIRNIWIISDIFALFWIVFLMNMINMGAKGIQGQLSGITIISALTIAILAGKFSNDFNQWPVIIISSILIGSYLGFLPWNFFPQKIMPGWSGSSLAGFMLAVLSIMATTKVGTLFVVLGIPIIDTFYTMIRRISERKSPVWGDRGHLHHRLLDAGLDKKRIVYLYWIFTTILGFIALNLNTWSKLYTIVGIALLLGGLLKWLNSYIKHSE